MRNVLAVFIFGFIIFGSFSAQNVNAQSSNEAQRLVGTWFNDNYEIVFNANGTGTFKLGQGLLSEFGSPAAAAACYSANIDWAVSVSNKLFIHFNFPQINRYSREDQETIMDYRNIFIDALEYGDYSLSPDAKRLTYGSEVFQKR